MCFKFFLYYVSKLEIQKKKSHISETKHLIDLKLKVQLFNRTQTHCFCVSFFDKNACCSAIRACETSGVNFLVKMGCCSAVGACGRESDPDICSG